MNSDSIFDQHNSQRDVYKILDAWRGFAALWVAMYHGCLATIANDSPQLISVPLYQFGLYGKLGVTIFFVVSGYCISAAAISNLKKGSRSIDFLWARVRRIYPPYFAALTLTVFLGTIYSFLEYRHIIPKINKPLVFWDQSFLYYFSHLTLTQQPLHVEPVLIVYWSLCYELAFYFVVAALIVSFRGKIESFILALNSVTVFSLIWLVISYNTCPFPLDLWPYFGVGALVNFVISQSSNYKNKIFLAISLVLIAIESIIVSDHRVLGHPSLSDENLTCIIFTTLLLFLYRFDLRIYKNPIVSMFSWVGVISYSFYLTHMNIQPIVNQIAKKVGFVDGKYWVSFVLQLIVPIVFAYGFHLLFERPFMRKKALQKQDKFEQVPNSS